MVSGDIRSDVRTTTYVYHYTRSVSNDTYGW